MVSKYQGSLKHRHLLKEPELPPPVVCKSCGRENRRYTTRDNGKGKRYYNLVCSSCKNAERRRQIRLINDPVRLKKIQNQRRQAQLRVKYGLTIDDYNKLFESQGGACAICGTTNSGAYNFAVDHCHKSNKVRGILCHHCNKGLGQFLDSPTNLRKAADYLDEL